jgi:hypothetical protein
MKALKYKLSAGPKGQFLVYCTGASMRFVSQKITIHSGGNHHLYLQDGDEVELTVEGPDHRMAVEEIPDVGLPFVAEAVAPRLLRRLRIDSTMQPHVLGFEPV